MAFERIVPGTVEWEAYHANHIQRYMFAAERLDGARNVLDAACGVGYGAQWLARHGIDEVTAVDRDDHALTIAREKFASTNVRYLNDDCHLLSEASRHGPFDAVVSFETLEHLPRPADFLRRCREVTTRGGRLLISTPNAVVTGRQDAADWSYHEKEYTPAEFLELLRAAGFTMVQLFGQRFTAVGRLRSSLRAEIHTLRFNPFVRAGAALQRVLRGRPLPGPALPEQLEDFEIASYASAEDCERQGRDGPFVLIGLAS